MYQDTGFAVQIPTEHGTDEGFAEAEQMLDNQSQLQVQTYQAGIYDLVRKNWSRPPSARNGMQARFVVELIPTGEVLSVVLMDPPLLVALKLIPIFSTLPRGAAHLPHLSRRRRPQERLGHGRGRQVRVHPRLLHVAVL